MPGGVSLSLGAGITSCVMKWSGVELEWVAGTDLRVDAGHLVPSGSLRLHVAVLWAVRGCRAQASSSALSNAAACILNARVEGEVG